MPDVLNPTIVIPGITASTLHDDYPLKTEDLWTLVANKEYERIALHPDDLRYEAIEPAHLFGGRLFAIYDDLIKSLRHELSVRADRTTPVFAFPYDWRRDVREVAVQLADFVEEVIDRTRLLEHFAGRPEPIQVNLVGHSMGGLVISEYLSTRGSDKRVARVATIGTPFRGSVEAVIKIATGMSLLSGSRPSERERESARVTPAVYQLFPWYERAVVDSAGREVDLFDRANMQHTVVQSLQEFVRMYTVKKLRYPAGHRAEAEDILTRLLEGGRALRRHVEELALSRTGLVQKDWLAIVGVGEETRLQLTVSGLGDRPRFGISDEQFVDELREGKTSWNTGDGTVPLRAALPPFLPRTHLVCVSRSDFGRFEVRDRLAVDFGGLHGLLPAMNLVQRLVIRHLRPSFRGPVWGRPVPGLAARQWNPPIQPLSARAY